ncbi:MAG: ABC transporter substrate-binding protein [Bacillota bacterium]
MAAVGLVAAIGALAGLIVAGSRVLVAHGRPAGTVVIGVPYRLKSLDPLGQPLDLNQPEALSPFRLVYDTLVITGPDGRLYPHLASRWDLSPDGREITFQLREARFHDGRPVDAAAVKYTLARVLSDEDAKTLAADLGPLKDIVVVAPDRVRLVFDRPYPPIWSILAWSGLGIVAPPVGGGPVADAALGPTGSGPYVPVSWSEGTLILSRNQDYQWLPPFARDPGGPRLEKVTFRFLPEPGARLAAFEQGQVDLAELDQADYGKAFALAGAELLMVPRPSLTYLGFSVTGGSAVGPAVREAAARAIDRVAVLKAAGGAARVETSILPVGMWAVEAGRAPRSVRYSPEKARSVLAAAGWMDMDGDGRLEKPGPSGFQPERLSLEILTYDYEWERKVATEVAAELQAVGIEASVTALEPREVLGRTRDGRAGAFVLTYSWYDPDILFYLFHSTRVGQTNRSGLTDPAVDGALEEALRMVEPVARSEAYASVVKDIQSSYVWVPLVGQTTPVLARRGVAGLSVGGAGEVLLYGAYVRP